MAMCDPAVSEVCCNGAHESCEGRLAIRSDASDFSTRRCECLCHDPKSAGWTKDEVNHPAHYGGAGNPHETYKCLAAWGFVENAYLWTAAKYLSRAGKKDLAKVITDLEKAKWYIDREIERLQKG